MPESELEVHDQMWKCELAVPEAPARWVVLHTRPRCEKKLCRYCDELRAPVYLPQIRKVHRYGARVREFENPLFPGYVFCILKPEQDAGMKQSQYVANLLQVFEQDQLVRDLQQIEIALKAEKVVEVLPYLKKGNLVRIKSGQFKDFEGVVEHMHGKTRMVINITMINYSMAIEVDAAFLAPA